MKQVDEILVTQRGQHAKVSAPRFWYVGTYAKWCLPTRQRQGELLEKLRIKWRYHWWDFRFMQRLGDFGRTYFGFLDRKRTGGGWW